MRSTGEAEMSDAEWPLIQRLREGRTNGTALRWTVTDVHREAAEALEAALSRAEEAEARVMELEGENARLIAVQKRETLARMLAALDGVRLNEVKSTVGPAKDANNWREYLGRADDLLAMISREMHG